MEFNLIFVVFISFVICIRFDYVVLQHQGIIREYCNENFIAKCNQNEIIIMQHAHYGRMEIGRCMKNTYGMPSCYVDALKTFDHLCSGKQECERYIPYGDLTESLSCIEEFSPYLEASYKCLHVYEPKKERCRSLEKIQVHKKTSYLASKTSLKTSCGVQDSPWVLEAQPGQQMELSLIDFAWSNKTNDNQGCSLKYGYILDMDSDDVISICGGGREREVHLFTSVGHSVQIVLEKASVKNYNFVVKFKAFGCPKYTPPKYAWIQKENESLIVNCEYSSQTWKLKCLDNIWLGIVGECTPPPVTVKVEENIPNIRFANSKPENTDEQIPSVSNNHVAVFSMGCVTVITCCSIVILGIFCTKRYEVRILKHNSKITMGSNLDHQNVTMRSSNAGLMTYRPVNCRDSIPVGTLELPPYSFPLRQKDKAPDVPERTTVTRDNVMMKSIGESDYLSPKSDNGEMEESNSVLYYVLENPSENNVHKVSNMSEEMYQSIHLNNSLSSNNV